MKKILVALPLLASVLFNVGCTGVGPHSVARDRFDYNTAISDSWKQQTLLNIVKLRYADMPLFVEVSSIVSGYTLESAVDLGGTLSDSVFGDSFAIGGRGTYTDRPTITYVPITGSQFNQSIMTPIPPDAILFLMQSGWAADMIFPLTVESINGLRSQTLGGLGKRKGDDAYYRAVELMRQIQRSGGVGMRIKKADESQETTLLFFQKKGLSPEIQAARQELSVLLGLPADRYELRVSYGLIPGRDDELALLTRSMLQIMIQLATQVEVPPEHIADGRTIPSIAAAGSKEEKRKLINIRYSPEKPDHAFTAARYGDYWYWIDDHDFHSKRTFAFLMILFSLTETGGKEGLPLVTIPSG